jgi:predicted RNA-binding Zn-ribbon protein involved in translation (DUF1610 family)
MTETATNVHFLPMRKADEAQQQALFHMMIFERFFIGYCPDCGETVFEDDEHELESWDKISQWLASETQLEGQRGREPDCVFPDYPTEEYMIALPSRIASRDIQEAGANFIRFATSAEKPCPGCGKVVRMQFAEEELQAVEIINKWLTAA